ncbi:ubiquinone/menaquinone biosynthesis methyltransferase [Fulvivirga imtechensis AK7]|uniref:Ubiquinone/menaquinone biosynthesis methyltransferase n=1 Tax=Fulvivirga imtechensis AK7 TaxID=1237149 RepID=L8JS30_9BACT|nr:class I SAM-dependent methyltransferase [Fulvivirga imtechensis]ELR71028.1 ubiquinone/menaquinone biosynthesis methyltransferase [Fulvivirga imtechensis AK7]
MHYKDLNNAVGNVDIYLLDQILKGRFEGCKRILDAGCGEGRNLRYFEQNRYDIYGIDTNPMAIKMVQMMYKSTPKDNFLHGTVEELPWKDNFFDAIICSAVLHFAQDRTAFYQMIYELIRVLDKKGVLFIRMATTIGLPDPSDTSFSYRLAPEDIENLLEDLGLKKLEPFKTVVVEDQRSMCVMVLEK